LFFCFCFQVSSDGNTDILFFDQGVQVSTEGKPHEPFEYHGLYQEVDVRDHVSREEQHALIAACASTDLFERVKELLETAAIRMQQDSVEGSRLVDSIIHKFLNQAAEDPKSSSECEGGCLSRQQAIELASFGCTQLCWGFDNSVDRQVLDCVRSLEKFIPKRRSRDVSPASSKPEDSLEIVIKPRGSLGGGRILPSPQRASVADALVKVVPQSARVSSPLTTILPPGPKLQSSSSQMTSKAVQAKITLADASTQTDDASTQTEQLLLLDGSQSKGPTSASPGLTGSPLLLRNLLSSAAPLRNALPQKTTPVLSEKNLAVDAQSKPLLRQLQWKSETGSSSILAHPVLATSMVTHPAQLWTIDADTSHVENPSPSSVPSAHEKTIIPAIGVRPGSSRKLFTKAPVQNGGTPTASTPPHINTNEGTSAPQTGAALFRTEDPEEYDILKGSLWGEGFLAGMKKSPLRLGCEDSASLPAPSRLPATARAGPAESPATMRPKDNGVDDETQEPVDLTDPFNWRDSPTSRNRISHKPGWSSCMGKKKPVGCGGSSPLHPI
jgi:hypothetical protein